MNTLPEELINQIVWYLPKDKLRRLFDVPVLGRLCFRRYYATIWLVTYDLELLPELVVDEEGESKKPNESLDPEARSLASVYVKDVEGVQFYSLKHFIDFCNKNESIYEFSRLVITTAAYYIALHERYPYIFEKMRDISLQLAGGRDVFTDSDYAFRANSAHDVATLINYPPPNSVKELTFHYVAGMDEWKPSLASTAFLPGDFSYSNLTSLTLTNFHIKDLRTFFASLNELKSLKLVDSPITDYELQHIPQTVTNASLVNLLEINETSVKLQFPDYLQYVNIDYVEYIQDSEVPIQVDLSHLTNLVGVQLSNCCVTSLRDIKLPAQIKHLCLTYSSMIRDLESLDLYDQLQSLSVDECTDLSRSPHLLGRAEFPESLQFFHNGLVSAFEYEGWVIEDMKEHYYSENIEGIYHSFLMVDHRTSWPNNMSRIRLVNPFLVINSTVQWPEGLLKLQLEDVHALYNIKRWQLPSVLKHLDILNLEVGILDNLYLPESLEYLSIKSSKLKSLKGTNIGRLPKLKSLILDENHLGNDCDIFSEPPPSLEYFSAVGNKASKFDFLKCTGLYDCILLLCALVELSEVSLKLPDSVEVLELDWNHILKITETFRFPCNLKKFNITKNPIEMDGNLYSKLPKTLVLFVGSSIHSAMNLNDMITDKLANLRLENCDNLELRLSSDLAALLRVLHVSLSSFGSFDLSSLPVTLNIISLIDVYFENLDGDVNHLVNLRKFQMQGYDLKGKHLTFPASLQSLVLDCILLEKFTATVDLSRCELLLSLVLYDIDFEDQDSSKSQLLEIVANLGQVSSQFSWVGLKEDNASDDITRSIVDTGVSVCLFE